MATINAELIAWAAGLFEGEGCICSIGKNSASASLGMTDRDVVDRFRDVVGAGTVVVQERPGFKTMYLWRAYSVADVRTILTGFLPYLGQRRRARAGQILLRLENCRGRHGRRIHCPSGHLYDEANTYITPATGERACRTCKNASGAASYQRRRVSIIAKRKARRAA